VYCCCGVKGKPQNFLKEIPAFTNKHTYDSKCLILPLRLRIIVKREKLSVLGERARERLQTNFAYVRSNDISKINRFNVRSGERYKFEHDS
jgi:hypothetical protein